MLNVVFSVTKNTPQSDLLNQQKQARELAIKNRLSSMKKLPRIINKGEREEPCGKLITQKSGTWLPQIAARNTENEQVLSLSIIYLHYVKLLTVSTNYFVISQRRNQGETKGHDYSVAIASKTTTTRTYFKAEYTVCVVNTCILRRYQTGYCSGR